MRCWCVWPGFGSDAVSGMLRSMPPVSLAADRSLAVPPGHVVKTGYVSVYSIRMGCRTRMAVGDVDTAVRKLLQLGDASSFPCPNGAWEDPSSETFVLYDGRHEWIAHLMLGREYMLVAWTEQAANVRISSR